MIKHFIRDIPAKGVHGFTAHELLENAEGENIKAYCYIKPTLFTQVTDLDKVDKWNSSGFLKFLLWSEASARPLRDIDSQLADGYVSIHPYTLRAIQAEGSCAVEAGRGEDSSIGVEIQSAPIIAKDNVFFFDNQIKALARLHGERLATIEQMRNERAPAPADTALDDYDVLDFSVPKIGNDIQNWYFECYVNIRALRAGIKELKVIKRQPDKTPTEKKEAQAGIRERDAKIKEYEAAMDAWEKSIEELEKDKSARAKLDEESLPKLQSELAVLNNMSPQTMAEITEQELKIERLTLEIGSLDGEIEAPKEQVSAPQVSEPTTKSHALKNYVIKYMRDYAESHSNNVPNVNTIVNHLDSISFSANDSGSVGGNSDLIMEVSNTKIVWKSHTGIERSMQRTTFPVRVSEWKREL